MQQSKEKQDFTYRSGHHQLEQTLDKAGYRKIAAQKVKNCILHKCLEKNVAEINTSEKVKEMENSFINPSYRRTDIIISIDQSGCKEKIGIPLKLCLKIFDSNLRMNQILFCDSSLACIVRNKIPILSILVLAV